MEAVRPASINEADVDVPTDVPFLRTEYVIGAVPPVDAVQVKAAVVWVGTPVTLVGTVKAVITLPMSKVSKSAAAVGDEPWI